jgi:2-keto-4-pentenoate hydratase/2-oxohepta-3-ene-1,7-dioic acid hydratase in catechol pathway
MRSASFLINGRASYGALCDGQVFEAADEFRALYPDLKAALAAGALDSLVVKDVALENDNVRFLPPIPNPGKVLCVGVNYRPHVEEMGREIPEHPVVFVRFADSLVGHGESLLRPRISEQYDFEGELAVVIGRAARYVNALDALDHVAGFMPFLDGSVRDWQRHTMQFTPGKNFPASGAAGPALVSPDEAGAPESIELVTRVSGETMQEGRVADLIFDVPTLIEYCSSFTALLPGDVIATGTPGGVGAARKPPRWLEPGDVVEVDLGPAGCLCNTVVAEAD